MLRSFVAQITLLIALAACSSGMDAVVRTAEYAMRGGTGTSTTQLDPRFRYIRVTIRGRSAFLALGSEEVDVQGPIENWYTAQREVLRLQNGRLVAAVGMTTEWRNVAVPDLPSWSALASAQSAVQWVRVRDVMPGYHYGVQDKLLVRRIAAPSRSNLQNVDPATLTWFEERSAGQSDSAWTAGLAASPDALPPARYAVDLAGGKEVVVYGEQCLAADLCFTWQRWPAAQ